MIYLGLDPGIQRVGYCVLKTLGSRIEILKMGTWHLVSSTQRPPIECRLEILYQQVSEMLSEFKPDVVGMEKVVSFKNISSAHVLSEARGVLRLALQQNRKDPSQPLKLWELSPTAVKKLATGLGSSDKGTILRAMLMRMPGLQSSLNKVPEDCLTHDTLDALAIAWSTWTQDRQHQRLTGGLKLKSGSRKSEVSNGL